MAGLSLPTTGLCIVDATAGEVGQGTFHPFGISYETLFKWAFRTKAWRFTVSFSGSSASASASATGIAGTALASVTVSGGSEVLEDDSNLSSELEMACFSQLWGNNVSSGDVDIDDVCLGPGCTGGGNFSSSVAIGDIRWIAQFDVRPFVVKKYSSLYYPHVHILASIGTTGSPPIASMRAGSAQSSSGGGADGQAFHESWAAYATVRTSDPASPTGSTSVTIDGMTFTANTYSSGGTSDSFSSGSGCSATTDIDLVIPSSIVLNPIEYWPYDPGDGGGPIWNSTSGAQIRDPFSVQTWN